MSHIFFLIMKFFVDGNRSLKSSLVNVKNVSPVMLHAVTNERQKHYFMDGEVEGRGLVDDMGGRSKKILEGHNSTNCKSCQTSTPPLATFRAV